MTRWHSCSKRDINAIPHPCFNHVAHFTVGRVHLPVAPLCNIKCNYCDHKVSNCIVNRPGLSSEVLSSTNAIAYLNKLAPLFNQGVFRIVGVAGPGEPLFNEETFYTLRLIRKQYPDFILCVCTNGLLLPDKIQQLKELNVTYLTITINAINPTIGRRIYSYVYYNGMRYTGFKAAEILIHNQLLGLDLAVESNFMVKVNTVYIPRINQTHILDIAKEIGKRGAIVHNIMPLIPMSKFKDMSPPTVAEIQAIRDKCEQYVSQFRLCRQCRADAYGIPSLKDFILGQRKLDNLIRSPSRSMPP